MARPRKATDSLHSIEECDSALYRLLKATTRREIAEANRDKEIADVTKRFHKQIADAQDEEKDLELQLQQYYMAHHEEIEKDGKKSVVLQHGVIGRRLTAPKLCLLNKSWSWSSVQARLKEKFGLKFIRQADPEPDKEAIKKAELPDDVLKSCGMKLDQDEVFYAEPARPAEAQ